MPATILVVGRGTVILAGCAFAALTIWAAATTWYIFSQEDVAGALLARQAQMQNAYEDRIGALRARLDRVASQKLLEQDSLEGRLSQLVTRQVHLETRQAMLAALASQSGEAEPPAGAAGMAMPVAGSASRGTAPALPPSASAFAPTSAPAKPVPEPTPFKLRLRGGAPDPEGPQETSSLPSRPIAVQIAGVEASLLAVEGAQMRTLQSLHGDAQQEISRLRTAIVKTGLDPDALEAEEAAGIGGPFIAAGVDPKAGPFEEMVDQVHRSLLERRQLNRTVETLPLRRPLLGDLIVTSGFGVRPDPFTRAPALHSGIDFRADSGTPVRASGAGTVVTAEYSGGYGNLVEIDHGNGVTSRFAHLSSIAVREGQSVMPGMLIGRAGSTGRSTGPHLHYETRIEGAAVDPRRFLRAGALLEAGDRGAE